MRTGAFDEGSSRRASGHEFSKAPVGNVISAAEASGRSGKLIMFWPTAVVVGIRSKTTFLRIGTAITTGGTIRQKSSSGF